MSTPRRQTRAPSEAHRSNRDRGKRKDTWTLAGGVPWPELGDGTPWTDSLTRVRHAELEQEVGKLQWVEWTHPDGSYMPVRSGKPTKGHPEGKPHPGVWMAVVTWDRRDQMDSLTARHPLVNLLPE